MKEKYKLKDQVKPYFVSDLNTHRTLDTWALIGITEEALDMVTNESERIDKLETIVKLFSKLMFYGDWNWETPNERTIEMLMREVGYYPFKDEDDMISKTEINESLYRKAMETIPARVSDVNSDTQTEPSA